MIQEKGGFGSLDLTNSKVSSGMSVLKRGTYNVVCSEAKYERVGNSNNWKTTVVLQDVEGSGQIIHNFNVVHTSSKAQEIGRDQLKTFLTHGGHPNPDRPGDVATLVGLKARVFVDTDGTYERNGKVYDNVQVKRFMPLDAPAVAVSDAKPSRSSGRETLNDIEDDEIPF